MRTVAAILACLALVKLGLHLLTSGQYGYHRDELYYLASAAHLDLGYVDYPPVTPLLGRLALLLFGDSLLGLRVLPALAGAAVVVFTGLLARVLGGRLWAQALAALAVLASPIFLGANLLFQTVSFDQLAWAVVTYAVARALRDGGGRWWLVTGAAFGVGLLTKYTIAAFGLGILIGLLATSARGQLLTPGPYLAGLLAALLFAPNVVWQMGHDWSSLQYLRTHRAVIDSDGGPVAFLVEQIPLAGPAGLVLLVVGARYLLGSGQFRALGVAAIMVEVLLLLAGGKSYYPAPIYPLLLAAAAVAAERRLAGRPRLRASVVAAVVLSGLIPLPILVPVLPEQPAIRLGLPSARKDYADMFGWPELAATVAGVYQGLPPEERAHATLLAANYGEAGALDRFGPAYGLPPAISPHLTYYYWKPAHVADDPVIAVGFSAEQLRPWFSRLEEAATLGNRAGVQNEEIGRRVYLCREPRVPLDQVWPELRAFD